MEEGLGVMEKEDLIFIKQLPEATPQALYALLYWISTQGCILPPCLLNYPAYLTYMQSASIMRKAGLEEAQAGIKIAGRNINNLRYSNDTTLMAESKEELMRLDESERVEWKSWLKTQHSKNED